MPRQQTIRQPMTKTPGIKHIIKIKQPARSLFLCKHNTVKPVNGQSKLDQTKVLMTTGSLMKVESIAECCNTFDLH